MIFAVLFAVALTMALVSVKPRKQAVPAHGDAPADKNYVRAASNGETQEIVAEPEKRRIERGMRRGG